MNTVPVNRVTTEQVADSIRERPGLGISLTTQATAFAETTVMVGIKLETQITSLAMFVLFPRSDKTTSTAITMKYLPLLQAVTF